jgi:hypothetical protein
MPITDMSAGHLVAQGGGFEPQRKCNGLLRIYGIDAGGSDARGDLITLSLQSFSLPKIGVEPLELSYKNDKRKFATFATEEDLQVSVNDFVDKPVAMSLWKWFKQGYDPITGQTGLAYNYKKNADAILYGPNGAYERSWSCIGVWISNFDSGEIDMSAGDQNLINLTLSIDKAFPGTGISEDGARPKSGAQPKETNSWLAVDPSTPAGATYGGNGKVHFTWFPDSFTTSAAPNWEGVQVLGRSEEFKIYANTGNREITVQFEFFAQGPGDLDGAIEREVLQKVRFLESLAYPVEQGNGLVAEPAVCWLKLGGFLRSRVIMSGAPNVTYMGPWSVDSELPMHATVDCTFVEVNTIPKEAPDVVRGSI